MSLSLSSSGSGPKIVLLGMAICEFLNSALEWASALATHNISFNFCSVGSLMYLTADIAIDSTWAIIEIIDEQIIEEKYNYCDNSKKSVILIAQA